MGDLVKLPDANTPSVADTKAVKMKKHVKRHKGKYIIGSIVPLIIALLQAWPMLCPMLTTADRCAKSAPLVEYGAQKLIEAKDAGL